MMSKDLFISQQQLKNIEVYGEDPIIIGSNGSIYKSEGERWTVKNCSLPVAILNNWERSEGDVQEALKDADIKTGDRLIKYMHYSPYLRNIESDKEDAAIVAVSAQLLGQSTDRMIDVYYKDDAGFKSLMQETDRIVAGIKSPEGMEKLKGEIDNLGLGPGFLLSALERGELASRLMLIDNDHLLALNEVGCDICVGKNKENNLGSSTKQKRNIMIAPELLEKDRILTCINTIYEEVIHNLDSSLGFSEREAWKKPVSKLIDQLANGEDTPGATLINIYAFQMENKNSLKYEKSEDPAELLTDVMLVDRFVKFNFENKSESNLSNLPGYDADKHKTPEQYMQFAFGDDLYNQVELFKKSVKELAEGRYPDLQREDARAQSAAKAGEHGSGVQDRNVTGASPAQELEQVRASLGNLGVTTSSGPNYLMHTRAYTQNQAPVLPGK